MPVALRQVLRIGAKEPFVGRIRGIFTTPPQATVKNTTSQESEEKKMPSTSLVLKYTKVVPEAYAPTKGSIKAAGYDLKSAFECTVPARGKALVDTGIKVQLPEGCYGRIAPRSGLAVKNFIDVGGEWLSFNWGVIVRSNLAGVVDEDYRGILKVVLFNHSDTDFEVKAGDRIAQLICERIYYPDIEEVKVGFGFR